MAVGTLDKHGGRARLKHEQEQEGLKQAPPARDGEGRDRGKVKGHRGNSHGDNLHRKLRHDWREPRIRQPWPLRLPDCVWQFISDSKQC